MSGLNLLFPFGVAAKSWFLQLTGRQGLHFYDISYWVDLILFCLTILWVWDEFNLTYPIEGNHFIQLMGDRELERGAIMMLNIIYNIDTNGYRFDFVLSAIAALTWIKCIF